MSARVLVAGVGNVLFGDDGFGCIVARACRDAGATADGIDVVDFGVRGFDLACALTSGLDAAIVVDAMPRGGPPGTLYVLDPELALAADTPDPHGLHPAAVLALARSLGPLPRTVRVVGCEPLALFDDDAPSDQLSAPVRAAVPRAVELTMELATALTSEARHA